MSEQVRDVTEIYRKAQEAADTFNPGQQVDICALMRAAYMHGYAHALLEQSPLNGTPDAR